VFSVTLFVSSTKDPALTASYEKSLANALERTTVIEILA